MGGIMYFSGTWLNCIPYVTFNCYENNSSCYLQSFIGVLYVVVKKKERCNIIQYQFWKMGTHDTVEHHSDDPMLVI